MFATQSPYEALIELATPADDGKIFWEKTRQLEKDVWGPKKFEEENNNN